METLFSLERTPGHVSVFWFLSMAEFFIYLKASISDLPINMSKCVSQSLHKECHLFRDNSLSIGSWGMSYFSNLRNLDLHACIMHYPPCKLPSGRSSSSSFHGKSIHWTERENIIFYGYCHVASRCDSFIGDVH